jgi:antitoxin component YwqK of YwqJK toxin-antitoxin module
MIEQEKDKRIVYQLPIVAGKENGLAMAWYNSGEKLLERIFVDGKREGIFKQWWPNGHYRYLFHYKNNQYHGTQMVFFPDGKKREVNNYQFGQLEGVQSTWNEAGVLISNYTIRDKKLYGVIAVKTCMPVGH